MNNEAVNLLRKMYDFYAGRLDDLNLRLEPGECSLITDVWHFLEKADPEKADAMLKEREK